MSTRFSFSADPSVPKFDEVYALAVMDGDCALCTRGARVIARLDRQDRIRICTAQSELGRALLIHHGLDPDDPESWLFIENGRAWQSMDAWIKVAETCGGIGHVLRALWVLPLPVRNWLYRRVALNRIRLFGRTDMCAVPDPKLRAKLLPE